jgi:AI-2 transport protein TqsA
MAKQIFPDLKSTNRLLTSTASWFIIVAASIAALLYLKNFLQPFIVAMILWFIIIEFRGLLKKIKIKGKHLPMAVLSILSTLIIFALFYFSMDLVVRNIQKLTANLGQYSTNLVNLLEALEDQIGINDLAEQFKNQQDKILAMVGTFAAGFASFVGRFFLVLFYVIFLLLEEFMLFDKAMLVLKSEDNPVFITITRIIDLFRDYITVKAFTSFLTGFLSYLVLVFLDIDLAPLWGFVIFLLNFIPSIGSIIGTAFPVIFSAVQYGDLSKSLYVLIGVLFIQILVGNILDPRLMGNKLNLSPLIIILALTFWGLIWGIMGALLSVPITAMMMIIFSQFPQTKSIAIFFSRNGDISGMTNMPAPKSD